MANIFWTQVSVGLKATNNCLGILDLLELWKNIEEIFTKILLKGRFKNKNEFLLF